MITYPVTRGGAAGSAGMHRLMQRTSSKKNRPMSDQDYRNFIRKMLDKARRTSPRHAARDPFAREA